ncbi:MAG: 50S ribosomal protein L15e [Candidatus Woesearchaeota archaeon]
MAIHKYLRAAWQSQASTEEYKQRMIAWRQEDATVRVDKPLRLDRAHSVGYKAKQGFVVVRQRVLRGGHKRETIRKGRRSAHYHQRKNLSISYQVIAEGRASDKFSNLEVLNSYFLCKDKRYYWFEVILIDPQHPNIKKEESLANAASKKGRVARGLTRAAKRSRGQRSKGKGHEKNFPSLSAKKNLGRGN